MTEAPDTGSTAATVPVMSRREMVLVLAVNYASAFAIGLVIGGIIPLFSLVMERWGVDPVVIGANSATASLGILVTAPFAPLLVRVFGLVPAICCGMVVSSAAIVIMGLTESVGVWFVLRFVGAAGLAVHWIISETWMSSVATERTRGRILAAYVTFIAAGFAGGPLILTVVGTEGLTPFVVFGVTVLGAAAPFLTIGHLVPVLELSGVASPMILLRGAPTVFAAAAVFGIVDAGLFTFLSIWGLRLDYSEREALMLVSAFVSGAVLLQLPIGWIADRVNRRTLLIVFAVASVIGPLAAIGFATDLDLLLPILVLWGGLAGGIYTIGLALLGDRFGSGQLAAANAAFVMTFEGTSLIGPPLAGVALELWMPHGVMALMAVTAAVFGIVTVVRGVARSREPGPDEARSRK